MTSVVVLGGGRVGGVAARDLVGEFDVTVLDADRRTVERLRDVPGLVASQVDLSDPDAIERAVAPHDYVIGALPGDLGLAAIGAIIRAGKSAVDISFTPEDPRVLHEEARSRGVTVIVDCGVAPGVSNMLVGRAAVEMDALDRVRILVGGIPRVRTWPYKYKAGFSPADVLEEYTRPARIVEDGRVVTRPALSAVETLERPEVGTVEAFLSDGLRTLMDTCPARSMEEKTIRYPGHANLMRALRESGFLGTNPVEVGGVAVSPRDLTAALLFPLWRFEEGEEDLTLMRIEIDGRIGGRAVRRIHDLSDAYDPETATTSMARTTAFPCTAVLRRLAAGDLPEPGVFPPEIPARRPGFWESVEADLSRRGIHLHSHE